MFKTLVILLFSISIFADLQSIENDEISMLEHIAETLAELKGSGSQNKCGDYKIRARGCSPVISNYMKDREYGGVFKFFVKGSPLELCSSVELNDRYYTSNEKLDGFFQKYTHGMVPSFKEINSQCFDSFTSLKDQNSAISYYYYSQMRLLQDGMMTLTSMASLDKKLGKSVLEDINCELIGQLQNLCKELKNCSNSKKDLSNDIADTKLALDMKSRIESTEVSNEEEKGQKERLLGGISRLYPWVEGKEFKNNFDKEKFNDDAHIENAIEKQLVATRNKLKKRMNKHDNLTKCLENTSDDCEDFHEDLNEMAEAPIIGSKLNEKGILGRHYQQRQSCINNQRNIRDSANDSANEFFIASGLTVATMGLGTIAVGSGHLIKGAATVGSLNRAQKIHRSLATISVQHSNKIKTSAKYMALSLNGAFSAKGISDAVNACQNDLDHLVEFKKLNISGNKAPLCPIDNQNPEFQLMSDIKSCAINAALASVDFIPAIPYGVSKFRASKPKNGNDDLMPLIESEIDPKNMKMKEMEARYHGESEGKSIGLADFPNPRKPHLQRKTKYLESVKMRKKFAVHARDGKLYDSQGRALQGGEDDLPGIFVIDRKGQMYYHAEPDAGRFHHSTFLAGEDVLSAGQIKVKDGKLLEYQDQSGHYKPKAIHTYQGIYTLLKQGVDFDGVNLDLTNLK